MINLPLYYYRHSKKSTYNKNKKETFRNSLKISEKHYKEITNQETPAFYKFLTAYYTDEEPAIEDVEKVYNFLEKTANEFKQYYKWTEEQYRNVKTDILRIIERYAVYKYLVPKYGRIGANFEIKEDKQFAIIRLAKRGKIYLKKNGAKKTICKIIQKVKGKIWKKN